VSRRDVEAKVAAKDMEKRKKHLEKQKQKEEAKRKQEEELDKQEEEAKLAAWKKEQQDKQFTDLAHEMLTEGGHL
jgi:hypothetical protein